MLQLTLLLRRSFSLMLLCLVCGATSFAQQAALEAGSQSVPENISTERLFDSEPPVMPPAPAEILKRFIAAEAAFRDSIREYAFMRDVVLQTIGPQGEITGEYVRNSQFVLDDRGGRVERVLYHPNSTIREMKITKEDIQDLAGAQLFGFELIDLSRYQMTFAGQHTINTRQTYAIDLSPKQPANPMRMRERFFVGRIWIDCLSFHVVKMRGVAVPQGKQRFPAFETLREESVKSEMPFPVSTFADEVLHFRRSEVHYRIRVRYYDYKRFASKVSIVEIEQPTQAQNH